MIPVALRDRSWPVVALAAAAYLGFIATLLWWNAWDASTLITAGSHYVDARSTPSEIYVIEDSDGYDGQFFYRIGLNPFAADRTAHGVTLDNPAYRHQRIMYPLLAWLVSGASAAALPWALIVVNLAAILALAWAGSRIAIDSARPAYLGLLFPMYPGFALSVGRDLSEPLAISLLVIGYLLISQRRPAVGCLALCAAILTRETTSVIAVAGLVVWATGRLGGRRDSPAAPFAIALALFIAWQGVMFAVWGEVPVLAGSGNIGVPFGGLLSRLGEIGNLDGPQRALAIAEMSFLMGVLGAGLWSAWRKGWSIEAITLVPYAVLVLCLTGLVWVEDWAFMRAAAELYAVTAILMLRVKTRLGPVILLAAAGLWGVLTAHVI